VAGNNEKSKIERFFDENARKSLLLKGMAVHPFRL
jgi:hypothetical protein